jgi:glycerol kinase
VTAAAVEKANLAAQIAACGITNQRETTLVWEQATGKPIHNAIDWQDTRTDRSAPSSARSGAARTGTATGSACRWRPTYRAEGAVDPRPGRRCPAAGRARELLFGTADSWLLWNVTGGADGGVQSPTSRTHRGPS